MNHPYLTDWELYIVFCNYYKPQYIELKFNVYEALLRNNQLLSLYGLPFLETSLNVHRNTPHPTDGSRWNGIPFKQLIFKSHVLSRQWLQEYIDKYRHNLLGNESKYETCAVSLKNTANFIQKLARNSRKDDFSIDSHAIHQLTETSSTSTSTRPYEDILVLLQNEYLSLNDIKLENSNILEDKFQEDSFPHFILKLTLLKPLRERDIAILSNTSFNLPNTTVTTLVEQQTPTESKSSEAQVIKPVTLHKINYETDFLPYKDALVLLYLAIGNKYLITEAGMKDSLPAISKMPFLTVRDGGRKHIEKALKKYAQPIKTYELALPDKTCCIIVTDSVEFNKHIQDYVTKYLNEQLENPNNYYQYGISWNMTVRWLNSLQIIHGNAYSLSPEVIKNNQNILINKASWIECLLKLIVDKRISLSEMTLDITKLPVFKVRIQQSEQLPFQESGDLEYLGITINKNNEVWYKDKKVPLDFRSRQFIFLKYLVQLGDNYKKVTNPIEEFKNYLARKLKERGDKKTTAPNLRGIQDYASQIRIKFERTVGTNAVTFHIVAGQTVLCLQNTASTSRKKRNKRLI